MNVAGALARGMYDGEPIFDSVARLLVEGVRTLPALATASGEPDDEGAEIPFEVLTGGVSVDKVVSSLEANPVFARMARPVGLSNFILSQQAGLPRFSEDEVNAFFTGVPERDPGYRQSWLELAPMDADSTFWVAYPQTSTLSLEFLLILPVPQGADLTQLLPLNMGLDVTTGATIAAPHAVPGTGCDPTIVGSGLDMYEDCKPRTCQHECDGSWHTYHGGVAHLTGCEC